MQKTPLYRYICEQYVSIGPKRYKPTDEPFAMRLTADDGKMLQKGDICALCVDTKDEDWNEVDIIENTDIHNTFVDVKFN